MSVNALQILRGSSPFLLPFPASSCDCVAIIAGVQSIDGPLQVKYWGCPDPCDPCGIDAYASNNAAWKRRNVDAMN